jgi:hypothetical protein
MTATVRQPGLYRFRGKIGVLSAANGVYVFTSLDSGGSLVTDVLSYEPERVASRWSDLQINIPSVQLTQELLKETLDSFADYLVEYCVEHAGEMADRWPSWVKVDHDSDETRVHWKEANVFEVARVFAKWQSAYRPSAFGGFEQWRALCQMLTPVKLTLSDLLELSQILRRTPTDYEHVLYVQAVSAFISQTLKQLVKEEGVTTV